MTDMFSSLPSHILSYSRLGLSYTTCTAISCCCKNVLLERSKLKELKQNLQTDSLTNTLFSTKMFSAFFPKLNLFHFVSAIIRKLLFQFPTNFI